MPSQTRSHPTQPLQADRHRPPPTAYSRWLALAVSLLFLAAFGSAPQSNAGTPDKNPAFELPARTVTNRTICLDPGDGQPCFALDDLRDRAPKWVITPPVWDEYPAALDNIPLIARTYSQETVEYLAAHEIRYGDQDSGAIALTFDCEIRPRRTMLILDTLRQEDVRATFFVQGRFVYQNPDVIRRMVADEHELGSHSFFHPLFTDLTPLEMTEEITYTKAAIAWAVSEYVPMRYFRFPYSGRNGYTLRHVASLGYQSSYWDMDPRGWEPDVTARNVIDHVRQHAHGGGILILHCSSVDDINALPGLLQALRGQGLTPGTLSEVLTPEDRDVPGYQVLPDP